MRYNGRYFFIDDVATIIRELCHVWEYQSRQPGFTGTSILAEHSSFKLDVYKYEISAHNKLMEFRFEQQCQILFDFLYIRSFKDPLLTTYSVLNGGLDPDAILPIAGATSRNPALVRPN